MIDDRWCPPSGVPLRNRGLFSPRVTGARAGPTDWPRKRNPSHVVRVWPTGWSRKKTPSRFLPSFLPSFYSPPSFSPFLPPPFLPSRPQPQTGRISATRNPFATVVRSFCVLYWLAIARDHGVNQVCCLPWHNMVSRSKKITCR